ncbi:MAG: transglutaminase family protein, partial [Kofleriaceae bacterium]|nr:transglutaminase family protein [Kofleriaceae bacterium]
RGAPWTDADAAALATALAGLDDAAPGAAPPLRHGTPLSPGDDRWMTVTPDPGVVEINSAPCPDGASFLGHVRAIYDAAAAAGLSAVRRRFNGDLDDSGGGGQLTLGGPSPATSPFFVHPTLLPRLIRYVNDHPSLSYWFLGACAGSASQAPRPDEGVRERWEELRLGVRWLERAAARDAVTPALLAQTLAPLLVDASGNSHRAELNVEKLWNPCLGDRGLAGLVEWRAFQMPPTAEHLAAAGALVRAIAARCALAPYDAPMIDWGAELHDRMALPTFLHEDLAAVLRDLHDHGVGLPPRLEALATAYRDPTLWRGEPFPGVHVTLSRAVEFWPLVGDTASQEGRTSRLVDASTERLELRLELPTGRALPAITAGDHAVTPHAARVDGERTVWVVGVRRRLFVPAPGLHPGLAALDPLVVRLRDRGDELAVTLHGWRPGGGPYDGVPDDDEATRRRAERLIVAPVAAAVAHSIRHDLARADTWTVDLRDAAPPEPA